MDYDDAVAALRAWAEGDDGSEPVRDLLVDGMCEAVVTVVTEALGEG